MLAQLPRVAQGIVIVLFSALPLLPRAAQRYWLEAAFSSHSSFVHFASLAIDLYAIDAGGCLALEVAGE
jgi:hypothetical protein